MSWHMRNLFRDKNQNSGKAYSTQYPGITIHETRLLRHGSDVVIPPHLFVARDYRSYYGEAIIQHGFGHFLQYRKHGFLYYYFVIAPISIWAAIKKNDYARTEVEANNLAHEFFGQASLMGTKSFPLIPIR